MGIPRTKKPKNSDVAKLVRELNVTNRGEK
jgi:hypothetical protein